MPIPTYEDLMLPLLKRVVAAPAEINVPALLPALAKDFGLTPDEVEERLSSGRQTVLANRCHWAQTYMRRAGLLESVRRGYFRATERGRHLLAEQPERIDGGVLRRYPEFAAWVQASRRWPVGDERLASVQDATPPAIESTPDEQIDTAAQVLTAELEAQLLDRVRLVDPSAFEQIVVDLLIAMNFGGGDPEMGKRLGRSGDGGIDGVIQEDALGLDAVYVQAKRYTDGNNVGAPDLRAFVGSLVGNRANKGVFVTASKFTAEAREYARNVQHRIVLIDGAELTRLMVRHGVGVRIDRTVVIKKIDEDYFSEE